MFNKKSSKRRKCCNNEGEFIYPTKKKGKFFKQETMDPANVKEVKEWMESVLGTKLENFEFGSSLKSGVVLCQVANKLKPNSVPK